MWGRGCSDGEPRRVLDSWRGNWGGGSLLQNGTIKNADRGYPNPHPAPDPQPQTRMSCFEGLLNSAFGWMFYVSKWMRLGIGSSFSLDKHHPQPSIMTSFAHGREGLRSFLLIHLWGNPRATEGGLVVQKGKCDLQLICLRPQGTLPSCLSHLHDHLSGRCACVPAQETHSLLSQPHFQALLST